MNPLHHVDLLLLLLPASRSLAVRPVTRRDMLLKTAALAAASPLAPAVAADEDLIEVFFGCGCFWHVQHEFGASPRRL